MKMIEMESKLKDVFQYSGTSVLASVKSVI